MLSDNEDENAIDKNFAIQNNLGDKLKGDIFTPKTFHSFKPKKNKKIKNQNEELNEADNVFFYENFLISLNQKTTHPDANKVKTFNSQKNIHPKKNNKFQENSVKPQKEKIVIIASNKNTLKTKHNKVSFQNYYISRKPSSNKMKDKFLQVKNIEKESPLHLNLKKENKTENNTNSNNNKLKLSKQQSLSSFCYTPNKSIDKNHLSVQECDKSCSFNHRQPSKSIASNLSAQKEKGDLNSFKNVINNINSQNNNNINNISGISNNSSTTKKNEVIIPKKKKKFLFFCCLPLN